MSAFPESVYALGDWLKAHPWVKRVKVPDLVWESYAIQIGANLRLTPSYDPDAPLEPVITWRMKQAMIAAHAWQFREGLFPTRLWRRS